MTWCHSFRPNVEMKCLQREQHVYVRMRRGEGGCAVVAAMGGTAPGGAAGAGGGGATLKLSPPA